MDQTGRSSPRIPASPHSPLWLGGLLFLVALLAASGFVASMTRLGESLEHRHGLELVETAAAMFDPAQVASLRGLPEDAGTSAHDQVVARLRALREANPEFRFAYLMRPLAAGESRFVFLADAEHPTSADYSAPGDAYDGPSENLAHAARTGQPIFSDVVADDWGEWVSALAPIRHEGKVVAVLGIDLAHEAWLHARDRYRTFALAIAGLGLALVTLFLLGLHLQRRAGERLASLGRQLAEQLETLEQAQEGLRLADVVVRHTSEAIMVLDPGFRILRVNAAYERLTGRRAADVVGEVPAALSRDPALARRISAAIAAGDHWQEELELIRADGSPTPVGALAEVVRDGQGRIEHFIAVLQDLSDRKALEARLRELSATDGLTGIANRRSFDETLAREWERGLRHATPLAIVMADIDFFKRYNDTYGHVAGDACLQQVAAALASGIRHGGDTVARYGGEEFAVVLPGADAAAACAVAESLRARVEALALPHAGRPGGGVVTISLGVAAALPARDQSPTGLVEQADQRLYRAKESGRNRVCG